ncbi:putative heme/steroid binding protein [Natranaerovirga pectinivora]|uniref:Putative heme/steroid binding protein n=1 Tax=Natranaerovirga pectinivora TaxID=682400 RepID=A0A4R3MLN6_9FIRM|nr:cytochrome b5 domain-containing protein [Natranaerovirga pectinivora]TCT14936.1 putative heme/steroid binding protein [Natranaerovirga pectinivora]
MNNNNNNYNSNNDNNNRNNSNNTNDIDNNDMVAEEGLILTREELANYDGREGRRAYVAVDGIIYDVTDSIRWVGGVHNRLEAGQDLTYEFNRCHPGFFVLRRVPIVGRLIMDDGEVE